MTTIRPVLLMAVAGLLLAVPLAAETFTITLTNGTHFESRYEPIEAPWDANKVLFSNDLGLRMTLAKTDIEDITAASEASGFGRVIDSTTIDLGILMVDIPPPEEDPDAQRQREFDNYMQQLNQRYDVDQFVDPSEAGRGGIPAWSTGATFPRPIVQPPRR